MLPLPFLLSEEIPHICMFKLSNLNLSIRFKLFSTLLLATGSVVLSMYLVMSWSFDRGFLDYVNQQDQQKYQALSQAVVRHHEFNNGWQKLSRDRSVWDALLRRHLGFTGPDTHPKAVMKGRQLSDEFANRGRERPSGLSPQGGFKHPFGRPPPPKSGLKSPLLLDVNKKVLIGRVKKISDLTLYPIVLKGKTIGYVGQLPRDELSGELDLLFVQQQSRAFMWVALVMVIVCVLAALPIAAHLVKPVRNLSMGTQRLIAGQYKTVIPVTSNDELGQLSKNFNSLANTLKENEKARKRWIADISHELRTPLAILKAEIEALLDGVRPSTPEALASLHDEVEQLNLLVSDLYELSMSDIGALNYQKSQVDVWDILQATQAAFQIEFDRAGLELNFHCALNSRPKVLADAVRLRQLFGNLCNNSLRYTDRPGRLEVTLKEQSGSLHIQFKDSAPGVNEQDITRLFERLYRVEASRNRASGGAGLGLSICHNIVAAHDGAITANASPLGGVLIEILLPLSNAKSVQGELI